MIFIYIYNVPIRIKYENKELYIPRKTHLIDGTEFTWWCKYVRKTNNGDTKFCNAKIKAIRDQNNIKKFTFYLLNTHSEQCLKLNQKNNVKEQTNN